MPGSRDFCRAEGGREKNEREDSGAEQRFDLHGRHSPRFLQIHAAELVLEAVDEVDVVRVVGCDAGRSDILVIRRYQLDVADVCAILLLEDAHTAGEGVKRHPLPPSL